MKFRVTYLVEVEIEVSEEVTKQALTDEWRSTFYKLASEEDVADHLAHNFVRNRASLSSLDGFANLPDDAATLEDEEWELESVEKIEDDRPEKKVS